MKSRKVKFHAAGEKFMATAAPSCQICGRRPPAVQLLMAHLVRPDVTELIRKSHPDWSDDGFICTEDLNSFRREYIRSLLEDEKGEMTQLENEVLNSIARQEILSTHVDEEFESNLTVGQRVSDLIARFGGSWTFIIIFALLLALWIILNTAALLIRPFDPYPYILLNLILSTLAAVQAPIIMMSQNRQEAKDRARASHDYQINLKAELEIRQIHQKLDHLLSHQTAWMAKIHEMQLEMFGEVKTSPPKSELQMEDMEKNDTGRSTL
jgi:uncharacterized membrane protein